MTLKLTAIMLAFALIIPSVANAASRQRLHSGQEQPRRPVFKVTGIIPTDHLNQKRITQMDKDRIRRSRSSGKGRRKGSRWKGDRGYQDGGRRQSRKGRRQGAKHGRRCEGLVARKVNRLNFTWTLTPGLGRGFSFLYRK